MARFAAASNVESSTRASALKHKKSSVSNIKGAVVPTSQLTSRPVIVGEALPRSLRARLGRFACGDRKPSKHVAVEVDPNAIGGVNWVAEMVADMGFNSLPGIMYSDMSGVSYSSPSSEAGNKKEAVVVHEPMRLTRHSTRGNKASHLSAPWTTKGGANKLRASRRIQQAAPRALSH